VKSCDHNNCKSIMNVKIMQNRRIKGLCPSPRAVLSLYHSDTVQLLLQPPSKAHNPGARAAHDIVTTHCQSQKTENSSCSTAIRHSVKAPQLHPGPVTTTAAELLQCSSVNCAALADGWLGSSSSLPVPYESFYNLGS